VQSQADDSRAYCASQEQWPALPASEVAVICDNPAIKSTVQALVSLFVDVLTEGSPVLPEVDLELK
jgi:hypothetical protein